MAVEFTDCRTLWGKKALLFVARRVVICPALAEVVSRTNNFIRSVVLVDVVAGLYRNAVRGTFKRVSSYLSAVKAFSSLPFNIELSRRTAETRTLFAAYANELINAGLIDMTTKVWGLSYVDINKISTPVLSRSALLARATARTRVILVEARLTAVKATLRFGASGTGDAFSVLVHVIADSTQLAIDALLVVEIGGIAFPVVALCLIVAVILEVNALLALYGAKLESIRSKDTVFALIVVRVVIRV